MSLDLKASQKFPSRWSKKQQVNFKNMERGEKMKQK
jgi:hypothetical protein